MRLGIFAAVAVLGLVDGPGSARAADETTQYRVGPEHGNSVPDSPLQPPLKLRWQANLGQLASNVVVAGGRVFYVRDPGTELQITRAARERRGDAVEPHVDGEDLGARRAGRSTGAACSVVRNHSAERPLGRRARRGDRAGQPVRRSGTATSRPRTARALHPTVANGELYLLANERQHQAVRAAAVRRRRPMAPEDPLRAATAARRAWTARTSTCRSPAHKPAPSIAPPEPSAGTTAAAAPAGAGRERWCSAAACSHRMASSTTHATGSWVGSWSSGGLPTWSGTSGVAYRYNTLRGFGPSYETTRWTFGIDEYTDLSLPLIAGSHVYTSTTDWSPYDLMALRLGDGARIWCQRVTTQPPGTQSSSPSVPGGCRTRAAPREQRIRARGVRVGWPAVGLRQHVGAAAGLHAGGAGVRADRRPPQPAARPAHQGRRPVVRAAEPARPDDRDRRRRVAARRPVQARGARHHGGSTRVRRVSVRAPPQRPAARAARGGAGGS